MLWRAEPRNALPCGAARRIARHRAASRCIALPCGAWRGEKTARPSGLGSWSLSWQETVW